MAGVDVIGGDRQKEAVNPSSLYTIPRLMMAQKALDSAKPNFVFIFLVRCIIKFSDAWMAIWMHFMINDD